MPSDCKTLYDYPITGSASIGECWWRFFNKVGDVVVLHVDLTPNAAHEANALAWLDKAEKARLRRYRHARPRREFVLCRAALRAVLCARLGCGNDQLAFDTSSYGKPFAVLDDTPAPISFSVSHSGRHGLIALAPSGRLGVDVEERIARHDPDGEIRTIFAPGEQAELASTSGDRKLHLFFALWTMKEALIKALGTGFALDMSRFEIPPQMYLGASTSIFRFPHLPTVRWRLDNLGNDRFAAAVAHELAPDPAPVSVR